MLAWIIYDQVVEGSARPRGQPEIAVRTRARARLVVVAGAPCSGHVDLDEAHLRVRFDEVMEWMKRCPALHEDGAELEIRRLIDVGDLPEMGEEANAMHRRLEEQVRR